MAQGGSIGPNNYWRRYESHKIQGSEICLDLLWHRSREAIPVSDDWIGMGPNVHAWVDDDFAARLDDELLSECPGGCGNASLDCSCAPDPLLSPTRRWEPSEYDPLLPDEPACAGGCGKPEDHCVCKPKPFKTLTELLRETEREIARNPEAHGTTAEDWERIRQWKGEK